MTRPYENLINAIVLQAVKDYRDALKRPEEKTTEYTDAMSTAMEIERFFHSAWYQTITSVGWRLPDTKAARGGEVKMTVKEYLHQAYRLDQKIKSDTMEVQNLRVMAGSVSAIQYDKDRVQTSSIYGRALYPDAGKDVGSGKQDRGGA